MLFSLGRCVTCSFLIRSVKQHDLHDLGHDSLFSVRFQGETFPFANQTSPKDAIHRMNINVEDG